MYIHRDKQVTLERELTALLERVDILRRDRVHVDRSQREALAWVVRHLRESIRELAQKEWARREAVRTDA